jgi:hydrogenase/urease accessory protein HupE
MIPSQQQKFSVKFSVIIAKFFFFAGVIWGVLGCVITFVPGAECEWFLETAFLVAMGLIIPQYTYRVPSLILLVLALLAADKGHKHGMEYQRWLSEHPITVSK